MEWQDLNETKQLDQIIEQSKSKPVAIFKHSTTCGISRMVYKNLAKELEARNDIQTEVYYLDLKQYRSVSNLVADQLKVVHESPQLIIIENGLVTHDSSHYSIDSSVIK